MGHFDPEYAVDPNKGYNLIPNSVNNTVDISYNVQEKANSQLELSGGWGNRMFVGTVGVSFNNFSTANFFNKEAWRPVPLGDDFAWTTPPADDSCLFFLTRPNAPTGSAFPKADVDAIIQWLA